MVVALRVSRVNERHLVYVLGEVWENGRDMLAALPVRFEFKGAFHQPTHRVGKEASKPIEPLQRLPVTLGQFRLVIPRIHMARSAIDEEPNDRFGLGLKVRILRRQWILRGQTFLLEQTRQAQRANAHASSLKHLAAVEVIQSVHCT